MNDLSVLSLKPNKKRLCVSAELIKTRLVSEALSITHRVECLLYEATGGRWGRPRAKQKSTWSMPAWDLHVGGIISLKPQCKGLPTAKLIN